MLKQLRAHTYNPRDISVVRHTATHEKLDRGEHDDLVHLLLRPFMTLGAVMYDIKKTPAYAPIAQPYKFPDIMIKGVTTKGAELAIEVKTTSTVFRKTSAEMDAIIHAMKYEPSSSASVKDIRDYLTEVKASGQLVSEHLVSFTRECASLTCAGYTPRVVFKSYAVEGKPNAREVRMFYRENYQSPVEDYEPMPINRFEPFCEYLKREFKKGIEPTATRMHSVLASCWNISRCTNSRAKRRVFDDYYVFSRFTSNQLTVLHDTYNLISKEMPYIADDRLGAVCQIVANESYTGSDKITYYNKRHPGFTTSLRELSKTHKGLLLLPGKNFRIRPLFNVMACLHPYDSNIYSVDREIYSLFRQTFIEELTTIKGEIE